MKFDTIKFAKMLATTIAGIGTTKIVASVVKANVPTKNLFGRLTVGAGAFVLGAIAADFSNQWIENRIDDAVNLWDKKIAPNFSE